MLAAYLALALQTSPELTAALDAEGETTGLKVSLSAAVLAPTQEGAVSVLAVAGVDASALRWDGTSASLAAVFQAGSVNATQQRDVSLSADARANLPAAGLALAQILNLLPGRHRLRAAVLDSLSRSAGTASIDLDVPPVDAFRLTTPILTDAVTQVGGATRPVPVAHRDFGTPGRLYYQVQVVGAQADPATGGPRVTTEMLVARADGTLLSRSGPSPAPVGPGGELFRLLALPLDRAAPGEYTLTLRARDEVAGRTSEAQETFRVRVAPPVAAVAILSPIVDGASHRAAVERYLAGGIEGALSAVATAWSLARDLADRLTSDPACPDRCRRAAVLLHTEAARTAAAAERRAEADAQLQAARTLAEAVGGDFFTDWLLAAGAMLEGQARFTEALVLFDLREKRRPGDPETLLAQGTVYEVLVSLPGLLPPAPRDAAPPGSESLPVFQERAAENRRRMEAVLRYERAVAAAPGVHEARLRLAWQRHQRAQSNRARADLMALLKEDVDPWVRALANLFVGDIQAGQDRGAEALRHYQAALVARTDCQAARAGEVRELLRAGRAREASEAALKALTLGAQVREDPWIAYHLGLSHRVREYLDRLRRSLG